jgi:signal transduction histidine kinase
VAQPIPLTPEQSPVGDAAPRARILLVDDDERNLLALGEVLSSLAEVVTASSGREALRHLLSGDFAVILLDVFMPGMDGYETAGLIRSRDQTARIPIIFLSAVNKETEHLMKGYAMGAVDYVFKPVDPLVLKSKVSVFVDLFEMRTQVEEKSRAEQALKDAHFRAELDRLRIEHELEASRTQQAAILDALPMALYEATRNASGGFDRAFIGGDLARLTGLDPEALETLAWDERIHPEDESLLASFGDAVLAAEYRWQAGDDDLRHFLDQCVRIVDPGGRERWAGTLLDVTQQKRLEAQLLQAGKMDAIGQLTGGVAHDFNNLLAAVLGGIHVLQRRLELGEREQLVLDQMRHAAEQGAGLVRAMMAFARKQDLTPAAVDPSELCESVAGLVAHTLGGTVRIDWSCPDTRCNLFVDKAQLELALVNLILNARDAMPGGGCVRVSIEELTDLTAIEGLPAGEYLQIRVADEGEGIPEHLLGKITEPFFTTKAAGKGTGLGLSMVAGFVQQSGGKIDISSSSAGTAIDLVLPATSHEVSPAPKRAAEREPGTLKVKSVLLVDDDRAVRTVVAEQLRELGLEVEAVADGASAIARLSRDEPFDLLLTDFAMPGMNGVQTILAAREARPAMRTLMMTGYADESSVADIRDSITVLRKPINLDDLIRALG